VSDDRPLSRWERWRFVLTLLLLVLAAAATFVGGCIRRYPVPEEPPTAKMPYSAIATWRRVVLPPLPSEPGQALPDVALRIAVGPAADEVFADTSLVDGREQGQSAEGWQAGLALVVARAESIVLIGAPDPAGCARLQPLADRLIVAAGRSGHGEQPPSKRERAEGLSRDPLGRIALESVCPEEPPPTEAAPDPAVLELEAPPSDDVP
jgi:hypothetical protein